MNIQIVRGLGYEDIQYVRYTQITRKGPHMAQPENILKRKQINILGLVRTRKT